MKGFKLNDSGDVEISNIDKLVSGTIKGETTQDGIPSVSNPVPLVGVTNTSFQSGKDTILYSIKNARGVIERQDSLKVDKKAHSCVLTRNCGYIELTGKEFWRFGSVAGSEYCYANVAIAKNGITDVKANSRYDTFLCSHLPYKYRYGIYKKWNEEGITGTEATSEAFGMVFKKTNVNNASNLSEFSAWVKTQYANGTPLTVVYPLSETVTTDLPYKDTKYNCEIQMINGNELLRQKVQCVLGTNKGEWFLNTDEGINFSNILGKGKSEDIVRSEIEEGLSQVDSSFFIEDFSCNFNTQERKLKVYFVAKNETGDTVTGVQTWD